jgi:hypothetical protein
MNQKKTPSQQLFVFVIAIELLFVSTMGELFHTHYRVGLHDYDWFSEDSGCGVTHHHTTYQKDDCLACVRANTPQSFFPSLFLRCCNETEFISLQYSPKVSQIWFDSLANRGPPSLS